MSVEFKFVGSYFYDDADSLGEALSEVHEFLEEEADWLEEEWEESHDIKGLELQVNIHTSCPEDEFSCFESVVEILGSHAESGLVQGWREDYEEEEWEDYPAGEEFGDWEEE